MKMLFAAAALITALSFTSANATETAKPLAGYFGNTVWMTDKDGKPTRKVYYNADGTVVSTLANGNARHGTWKMRNNNTEVCITRKDATSGKETTACHPSAAYKKLGDIWIHEEAGTLQISRIIPGHK